MTASETGDIWTGTAGTLAETGEASEATGQAQTTPALETFCFEKLEPLDAQFGVDPKKSVPDALLEELFGQPDPTPAEVAAAEGREDGVAPLNTFVILDAAKVPNLPEVLATSGLEHECLFIGEAKEDLGEVAPWIVHLTPDSALTRHIFTTGRAPWQLWDKNPGMLLRARATCTEMHKHFRKILKVQDDADKWFYFRFWEGTTLLTVAQASAPKDYKRLYRGGMIAYGRHTTPDGPAILKSWVGDSAE